MKSFTKCITLFLPLAVLSIGPWIWADVLPDSQATTQVQVINSQGQYVSGAVVYWTAKPMVADTGYHIHGGTLPYMTLSNPQVDYSYTNSSGIATMVWNTPEYSGHYPWTATCPACKNWSTGGTVYVDNGFFGTQLPAGGTGYGTQYDGGHPNYDFASSSFMLSKAANIGAIYSAATLSHDGVAKSLIYTRTGLPQRGTLDNNYGTYFELRSNPDPHLDLREVIDIVFPGGNDGMYLEQVLENIRTSGGALGWQYYGVGNNLQGQNILHADGT